MLARQQEQAALQQRGLSSPRSLLPARAHLDKPLLLSMTWTQSLKDYDCFYSRSCSLALPSLPLMGTLKQTGMQTRVPSKGLLCVNLTVQSSSHSCADA